MDAATLVESRTLDFEFPRHAIGRRRRVSYGAFARRGILNGRERANQSSPSPREKKKKKMVAIGSRVSFRW